jgi:hypothetical protein
MRRGFLLAECLDVAQLGNPAMSAFALSSGADRTSTLHLIRAARKTGSN